MPSAPRTIAVLAAGLVAALATGCNDDCDTFCSNQANHIEECLPQFEQTWADVGDGNWSSASEFTGACVDQIDAEITSQIAETCNDEATKDDCESSLRQGVVGGCTERIGFFNQSCSAYWRSTTDFTPTSFDPVRPPPVDDDDSSAVDDDDSSAVDDDDSSAVDDDDSSAVDDDDSSAVDDDDSSAPVADDDDSSAPVADDDDSSI